MDICKNCVDFCVDSCNERCEPRRPDQEACCRFRPRANNQQIDNTDYYALPDGTQLEDAMFDLHLDGPTWSGVKYLYRAGKKSGESTEKDQAKAMHFAEFLARKLGTGIMEQRVRFSEIIEIIMKVHGRA